MSSVKEKALAELHAYKTEDEVLMNNLSMVMEVLEQSETAAGLEFDIELFNQDNASADFRKSRYSTLACKALLSEHLIVVNERFLIEIECAIRSFEVAGPLKSCPYVRSDADLFGLIDRIGADPYSYVSRMRRITQRDSQKEQAIRDTIALTYLFFIGHEVGHLSTDVDARSFTEFVHKGSPLEDRIDNAVVKLRRHAEEFNKFNFGLPGFNRVLSQGDEIERSSARMQNQIESLYLNHTRWFQDEVNADENGTNILLEHLSEGLSDEGANSSMYHNIRGVFAATLYAWYRDLQNFCDALGLSWPFNISSLVFAMMKDREQYIKAASLFGDVHRFTLLRAERLIESLIKARSNIFDKDHNPIRLKGSEGPDFEFRLREVTARYYLLCMLMDTAVKIAYVGASTAWMKEKDLIRGTPQLFMMTFESITLATKRVFDLPLLKSSE